MWNVNTPFTSNNELMNTVNKLLKALGHNTTLHYDNWTKEHEYISGKKKWIANILPYQLLRRSVKKAVESIVTLCECDEFFQKFPENIESPNYGDKWGRLANYIEINNRAIAEMHRDITKNGILSSIKILPAIPPSTPHGYRHYPPSLHKNYASCLPRHN